MRIDLFFYFSVISAPIDTQSCSILQIGCGWLEHQLIFVCHQRELIWLDDIWCSIENFGLKFRSKNRQLSFHDSKNSCRIIIVTQKKYVPFMWEKLKKSINASNGILSNGIKSKLTKKNRFFNQCFNKGVKTRWVIMTPTTPSSQTAWTFKQMKSIGIFVPVKDR